MNSKATLFSVKQRPIDRDQLLQATFSTKRGRDHKSCLLHLAKIDSQTLTLSTDQFWALRKNVYLAIKNEKGESLHFTVKPQSRVRAKGQLWFYRLKFATLTAEEEDKIMATLENYSAPEGRQYYRHYCPNPFEISVRLNHSSQPVSNISCSGLQFSATEEMAVGDLMRVKLFFDGFAIRTAVKVDRKIESKNGFNEYGCSFHNMTPEDSGRLRDYIYRKAQKLAA